MSKRFQKKTEPRAAANPPKAESLSRPRVKAPHPPGTPKVEVLLDQPAVPFLDLDQDVEGRVPPIKTRQIIRALGQIHATIVDLATIVGVTEPTMHAIFKRQPEVKRIWDNARTDGRISLRRKLVESPAPGVQIFLAKNILGMRDQFDVKGEISHEHNVLVTLFKQIGEGHHGKLIEGEALPPPSSKVVEENA